jgi:hypothetical protein
MEGSTEFFNSLSEVRKNIIEDCMTALGYPVISLFITQEQINRLIDLSVRKCSGKACPRFLQTLYAGGGAIDVSKYGMSAVSAVYSADIGASSSSCSSTGLSGCDMCEKLCQYRGYSQGMLKGDWDNSLFDRLAYMMEQSEWKNLELSDYYLDVSEGKLYVDNFTGAITVEYVKGKITVEDLINDSFWLSWVSDYTLAMVKITEGRIRGKYKATSGVFEIEADELVSEGNTDKQELEERLNENIGYWNIMRG